MKSATITLSEISSNEISRMDAEYWITQKEVEKIENKLVEIESISKKIISEYANITNIPWRFIDDFSYESVKMFLEKNELLFSEEGNYCFGNYYIWHNGKLISLVFIRSKIKEHDAKKN